jgi:hypothetical protein
MQLAKQSSSKAPSKPAHSKKKSAHAGTMQAIHATWRKVAPPTVVDAEDLRNERLNFAARVLSLNQPLKSMSGLSGAQLGRVLDAMRALERAPGANVGAGLVPARDRVGTSPTPTGDIHHLATTAQVEAIDKLFAYLGSSPLWIEEFLETRFRRKSQRLLTPAQANSCTMILFNIAASRDIKQRWQRVLDLRRTGEKDKTKVTREMIRAEIPALKRRLGIDQKPDGRRSTVDGHSDGEDEAND